MLLYKHYSMEYIVNLFRNPDNGLWFLIVLFCIQLWYLVLQLVCSKIQYRKRYIVEGAVGIVFIVCIFALNKVNQICSGLYTNYIYYIMFFSGSYVAKYLTLLMKSDIVMVIFILGFIVFVPKFHMWQTNSSLLILAISLFASIVTLRIGMALENREHKNNRLLEYGKTSLAIYIIHFYLVKILNGITIDTSDVSLMPLLVILFGIACFICFVCVSLSNVISQNRLLNFLVLGRKLK